MVIFHGYVSLPEGKPNEAFVYPESTQLASFFFLAEYLPVGIQESKMSHAKTPWLGIFNPAQNDPGFHWRVVRAAAGFILGIEG